MRPAATRKLPIRALLCSLLLAAWLVEGGCARRSKAPVAEGVLVALLDRDATRSIESSRTPRLVVYDSGRIIARRESAGTEPGGFTYWTGQLSDDERLEVEKAVQSVLTAPTLVEWCDSERRRSEPGTVIVFGHGTRGFGIHTSGRWTGEEGDIANTPDLLEMPRSLALTLQLMTDLLKRERQFSRWQPEAVVVRACPVAPRGSRRPWPAQWPSPPALDSATAWQPFEFVVPVASDGRIATGKSPDVVGPVSCAGRAWSAQSFPAIPGHEAWDDLLTPPRDERAEGDLALAFESAALIATADFARIGDEAGPTVRDVPVRDARWIRTVAEAMAEAPLIRSDHCFCLGWKTTRFYRRGEFVMSLAAIHGNQLRITTEHGSGDFPVEAAHWQRVSDALIPPADELARPPQ